MDPHCRSKTAGAQQNSLNPPPALITPTQLEQLFLDASLNQRQVSDIIVTNNQAPAPGLGSNHPKILSFASFSNTEKRAKWRNIIAWLQTFDPTAFLVRRINSEAPIGNAATDWTDCLRAATNLLSQCEQIAPGGSYIANQTYDQLQMLIHCMLVLLLRVRKNTPHDKKIATFRNNCARFLRGEWRGLTETALEEQDAASQPTGLQPPEAQGSNPQPPLTYSKNRPKF